MERTKKEKLTKRVMLAIKIDEERKARLEKIATTTQLGLALETEEERRVFNLYLIRIEIEVKKIFFQGMSSLTLQCYSISCISIAKYCFYIKYILFVLNLLKLFEYYEHFKISKITTENVKNRSFIKGDL